MQQTADVDANQTLAGTPVSGSFSCFCAVADVAMAVADMAMTVACGSSYYSSAVADLEMAVADVVAAVDAAVATTAASSHLSKQLRRLFYKVKMREIRLNLPRSIFLLSHI